MGMKSRTVMPSPICAGVFGMARTICLWLISYGYLLNTCSRDNGNLPEHPIEYDREFHPELCLDSVVLHKAK